MNENNNTVIQITNLVKEYKMFSSKKDRLFEAIIPKYQKHSTFRAMDELNLEVKKGEVLGILGKNGAGKSTLLKMITGVVQPTSGSIEVNGKISSLLELGAAFNPDLTGYENIYQHGQVMGLTDEQIKEKEQEIIEFADIGEHLNQPVKTYSSGMFARLAFACAINVDPDILIVDEVLSVGDMAFQLKCFKRFEQFKEAGKTILFVTHSVADILRNCTRTIIVNKGKKIFDGSVKDGVELYKKIIVGIEPEDGDFEESKSDNPEIKIDSSIESEEKIENKEFEENKKIENLNEKTLQKTKLKDTDNWKEYFIQNPKITNYGNLKAEVIDYGIFDLEGNTINSFDNSDEIILKSKIKFNEDVKDPIFTMTIKDFRGNDLTGTNTEFEKIETGSFKKGETAICEFKQKISLAPGKYTVSFSCTKYDLDGNLMVLNRKYDALLVEVITTKSHVGLLRLDSDIKIKKI